MCADLQVGRRCQWQAECVLGCFYQIMPPDLTVAASASVPHDLAHQCLTSMPFESNRAVTFLNQVRKYLEFQSTVDVLKSRRHQRDYLLTWLTWVGLGPPSGYMMPATDLLGGIDSITIKARNDGYASQFEMDLEVSNLIRSAYDGHLAFQLCSQAIFNYEIDMPLLSISTDGLDLPEVYTLSAYCPLLSRHHIAYLSQTMPNSGKLGSRMFLPSYLSMAPKWPNFLHLTRLAKVFRITMPSMFSDLMRRSFVSF